MTEQMQISRVLSLESLLREKSYFLLGPRQTGKSFMIRDQLPGVKKYNLLKAEDFQRLSVNPGILRAEISATDKYVVIDEIQKLPSLLDEVQLLIEEKKIHFLLTGSSARKLRRQGVNLLGGRARLLSFHPFSWIELKDNFDLGRVANYGLLPSIYFSSQPEADLQAYVGLYLQEEIANEALTRNLPAFSRFLEVAALCHAEQVDYSSLSRDAQVPRTTIHEYFQILKDTLMVFEVPAWKKGTKRKPVATSKMFFFDWGLVRKLQKLGEVNDGSPLFGKAFESFIFHEARTYMDYNGIEGMHYWRTQQKDEVDFILGERVAVEVKAKKIISPADLKGLKRLKEEKKLKQYFFVYRGPDLDPAENEGIEVKNYENFLRDLWGKKILK